MKTQEVRQEITNKIIESMNAETLPWRAPWDANQTNIHSGMPTNIVSKQRYRGVNPILLMSAASLRGFKSKYWGTMKQWFHLGAVVKPPPKFDMGWGTDILFSSAFERNRESPIPNIKDKGFFSKLYKVYNADQVESPTPETILSYHGSRQRRMARIYLNESKKLNAQEAELIHKTIQEKLDCFKNCLVIDDNFEIAQNFVASTCADVKHFGNKAVYWHAPLDYIQMPPQERFNTLPDYYETLYHELCHWAEAAHRLGPVKAYKENYPFGELVAELGACFLAAETRLPMASKMLPRSISYLQSWLWCMEKDVRYIFEASTQATKIVDYLLKLSTKETNHESQLQR